MWHVLRERRSFFGASLVSVLVVASIGIAALNSHGYRTTKVDLNDGEVWTINHAEARVGRVNMQVPDLDVGVDAANAEVIQDGDTVLIVADNKLSFLDQAQPQGPGAGQKGQQRPLPANGVAALGGPTGAVLDRSSGDLWVTTREGLVDQSSDAPRTTNVGRNSIMAVGLDGTVYTYSNDAKKITVVSPSGSVSSTSVAAGVSKNPQISVVGSTPVLVDPDGHRLLFGGGGMADLDPSLHEIELQQPGPKAKEVLVNTEKGLLAVPLGGGSARTLFSRGAAAPAAPVRLGSCVYGAWSTSAIRLCDGKKPLEHHVPAQYVAKAQLVYRVNHNQILLNDVTSGWNLAYLENEAVEVNDWDKIADKNKKAPPKDLRPDLNAAEKPPDCATAPRGFTAVDYTGSARVGQPAILHVLDGVKQPACQVLRVSLDATVVGTALSTTLPGGKGAVAVVDNGDALQFTPAGSGPTTVSFPFWVGNGVDAPQQRTATVTVLAAACTANSNDHPPVLPDAAAVKPLLVASGKQASYNVLNQARDPDGDLLALVDAQVASGGGTVQYQTNGQVTYTGASPGTVEIAYHVADQCGAQSEGRFTALVQGGSTALPPTAQPAHLQLIAGQWGTVNLLATASDPANEPLTLQGLKPDTLPGWEIKTDPDGTVRVRANLTAAASHTFQYTISNGTHSVQSSLRVDVLAPDAHDTPIAVRDSLLLRPGVPGTVDLTANDIDPAGAVLAVQSVAPGDGADSGQLIIELIDLHILRVTAPGGFSGTATVQYTVSNGSATAQGVVVVQALDQSLTLQAPVPGPDTATVKVGNTVAIAVLSNDVDPQGGRLHLTEVTQPPKGTAWIEDDQLRFQAAPDGSGTQRFTYTVANDVGNASGIVTVHVQPAAASSQPLDVPDITERVFAGSSVQVRVPLLTVSPDGDIVTIVGLDDPPSLGRATVTGDGFTYTADSSSAGTDTFTYRLASDHGDRAVGTVRVAVIPRPAQAADPVAVPVKVDVAAGDQRQIDVLASVNNPYGDVLSIGTKGADAFTQPKLGHVELKDGEFTYRAPSTATDGAQTSFSYVVLTDRGGSAHGTVTVTLHAKVQPTPPVARDDFMVAQKPNTDAVVDILANDVDPMGHLDRLHVQPAGGATFGSDRKLHVHVGAHSVRLTYRLVNPDLPNQPAIAVVTVPVINTADGPVTSPISLTMDAGQTKTIHILDAVTVAPGRTKELVKADKPRGGTLKFDQKAGTVTFTADADGAGDGGFNYLVTDGKGGFASDQVNITIRGLHPPTWPPQQISMPADSTRNVDLNALLTNADPGNTYDFAVSGGTDAVKATTQASGAHTNLVLTAGTDAHGKTATLSVKATNHGPSSTKSATNTITVTVVGTDKPPPTAVDDDAHTDQGKPVVIPVTANDVDPVGKGLKIDSVSAVGADQRTGSPAGSAVAQGDSIQFTPSGDFYGAAHFTYTVVDATNEATHRATANVNVIVEGKPGAPGAPTGIASSHQVLLTWPPADPHGDYPITYVVQQQQDGGGFTTAVSGVGTNSAAVTGLANGHAYVFRIQAKNQAGESPWSPSSSPQAVDAVPDPPTGVSAPYTAADHVGQQLTVQWNPAQTDGSPVDQYKVVYSGGGSQQQVLVGAGTRSTVLTGLQNGATYNISVYAHNSAKANDGWSDPGVAGPQTAGTWPAPMPAPAVDQGDRTITVHWQTPSGVEATGGHDITGYAIYVFSGSSCSGSPSLRVPVGSGVLEQPLAQGSVANGQQYSVCMRALNDAADPNPNAMTNPALGPPGQVTPVGKPGAPTNVSMKPTDGGAQFSYSGADPNGSPIDSVQVTMNGTTYTPNLSPVGPGASGSFTVAGLNNGTTYGGVQVALCHQVDMTNNSPSHCSNPAGSSPGAVTPFGPPSGPSISGAWSGNQVVWHWSAGANGAPVTNYSWSGSASGSGLTTSATTGNYGCGAATATLTVTAYSTSQGVTLPSTTSKSVSKGDSCPHPTVSFSRGASAPGYCFDNNNNPVSPCYWVNVTLTGFSAGPYQISCYDSTGPFPSNTVRSISVGASGSWSGQSYCAVVPGYNIYVKVGSTQSTTHGI